MLFQLVQAGQLIAVRSGDGEREVAYSPAHEISTLTLYGVLKAVEQWGQTGLDFSQTPDLARVDREVEKLKQETLRSPDNVRIVDLL